MWSNRRVRRAVSVFVDEAAGFRAVVDSASAREPRQLVPDLAEAMARMYLAALTLPDTEPETRDLLPEEKRRESAHVWRVLRDVLADADEFVDVWDPTDREERIPIRRSVSAEVAEIYEDMTRAVALAETYGETAAVSWELKWAFDNHWGKHCVDVLRVLERLRSGGG